MSKNNVVASEQKTVKWNQIYVPEDGGNIRRDLPRIQKLADNLKARGQLEPVIVTNGQDGDKPYTLVAGYRRMAAFEMNGWQNEDIMIVVRSYKKGDSLAKWSDNWDENMEREDFSAIDQGEFLHSLATGTYPVAEGEEASPVGYDEIATRFSMSKAHAKRLVKVFTDVDADVAKKARSSDAPMHLLFKISMIEGSGKDKDAKEEDRAEKQMVLLDEWISHKKDLETQGRKRAQRSDKGQKQGAKGKGTSSVIEDEGERKAPIKSTKRIDEKGHKAGDYLTVLHAKVTAGVSKEEGLRIEGMISAFRFMTGELKKLPGLVAADFKVLEVEEEEEEVEEEEEAE